MRPAIAYAPGDGPLQRASAASATIFLGAFAAVAFVFANPLVLVGSLIAVIGAGWAAGARRALASAARWGLALGTVVIAVNGLASQRGETIIFRVGELPLLGRLDISAEALAEGGILAVRIVVVLCAFAVHSACVDPDRLLRLARPIARHSALTATLIARMVPLSLRDYARLSDAVSLRGPAAASASRAALARRLVAGSLDRAVDVAATLELRGYAHGAPRAPGPGPRPGRGSAGFAAAATAVATAAVAILLAGAGGFEPYPTVRIEANALTLGFASLLPLLALAPFARRGFVLRVSASGRSS